VALCNSTWTFNHTKSNWGFATSLNILYPPCNVEEFWYDGKKPKEPIMVSFAQFRPEKRHHLQLDIWKKLHTVLAKQNINV
jgi:alpha-1,2-mannosyltransferase